MQAHLYGIVPEAAVEAVVAMFTAESEERLLQGNPDYVVDAIDDIDTKVDSIIAVLTVEAPGSCVILVIELTNGI